MDIPIAPKKVSRSKLGWTLSLSAIVVVAVWLTVSGASPRVHAADITYSEVKQGRIMFSIPANGVLVPRTTKLSTARAQATVEEILVEAGAVLKPGDQILRLSSTQLLEQLEEARSLHGQAQSDFREAQLDAKRDSVSQSVALANLKSELILEEKEAAAKRRLLKQGVISEIEMERADAKVKDFRNQVAGQAQLAQVAGQIGREKIAVRQSALTLVGERLARIEADFKSLTVVAAMPGTVQEIYVSPGQTVAQGEKLFVLTGSDDLIARLKIAQNKAPSVAIGSAVTMNLQGQRIQGTVIRIDPKVLDGSVTLDVQPSRKLPPGVRPEQSVSGDVQAATPVPSLYTVQRGDLLPYAETQVFVRSGSAQLLRRTAKFGAAAGDFVEVASGLVAGDRIAIGVDREMYKYSRLSLVN